MTNTEVALKGCCKHCISHFQVSKVVNVMGVASQNAKAILLDFDGVLRYWPSNNHSIEDRYRLPRGSIKSVAFAHEYLDPAIRGTQQDAQWRESIALELDRQHPQSDARKAVNCWSEPVGRIDTKVLDTVQRYCVDTRLVLATNATSRLNTDLRQLGIQSLFFGIANSSALGVVKPEKAFYLAALDIANTGAEQTIYIDDDAENVMMAEQLGIRSHQFTGIEGMARFLDNSMIINR